MLPLHFRCDYRAFSSYWWKHWLRLRTFYRPIVWFWQRGTRGYADCDLWNLDGHIADVLIPALRQFRATQTGHPGKTSVDEWNTILDKMVEGFEASRRISLTDEHPDDQQKFDEGMELFHKWYFCLWD